MGLFTQAFSLLADPPGNLLYHLVLVFSIAGALQAAFIHWRISAFPQARRTVLGLTILMLPQVILFVISGLGWQGIINLTVFLPPLDRAMTLIGLVWIIWLWSFPEPNRAVDAIAILLTLFIATGLALSLAAWGQDAPGTLYNTTFQELVWQIVSLVFIAAGIIILFVRRPNGWGNGLAVLLLALAGHSLHLIFGRAGGNYPGVIRVAYMAIYPFLMTLPQRFPMPAANRPVTIKQDAPVEERRHYSTDPKTFHALLALAAETNPERVSEAITRGIAQTLLADLCFLIHLTEDKNHMVIASGYDLIREENLEGASLSKNAIPMLTNAIQRGRPLRLPASSTSADIKGLGEMLGLSNPGHMMSVPIITEEKETLGGILVLSPYSERAWRAEDQAFLSNISMALVPIIRRSQRFTVIEQKQVEIQDSLDSARNQIDDLVIQNKELQKQLESARTKSGKNPEQEEKIASLLVVQQESLRQIELMQKENEELRAGVKVQEAVAGRDTEYIEAELRASLKQVARLQNDLADANMKLLKIEKGQAGTYSSEQAEVIASIAQELRQPMSSVVGYTDLLLGESVGILGSLQRKFVERIKSSTERIGTLIDDMIQVTNLETGLTELKPEPVDLNMIIDNAMSYTSSQIREKNITLHLDLPKNLQSIYADREALQQILIHLLQNAGAVSPNEGTITLKVQTRTEDDQEYVLLQVTDTGGGIPSEDIPRVFMRLYRADNVLIEGVGDTGVGLSIAKTLTEAQNGRIWVESEAGVGSTFSVLLPMSNGK
ncbi:MAG: GAF domain-containing protein [Chloroflexi bacterium]|nr:MAG: GAF domain-containing protein [Chloroflexota bacterium]